ALEVVAGEGEDEAVQIVRHRQGHRPAGHGGDGPLVDVPGLVAADRLDLLGVGSGIRPELHVRLLPRECGARLVRFGYPADEDVADDAAATTGGRGGGKATSTADPEQWLIPSAPVAMSITPLVGAVTADRVLPHQPGDEGGRPG